ncbi:MAG: hypothetical protein K8W52_44720, partial [Deltaproteobacteria bacterium]|nr:hypothetical protein [Deltaproteobacteria bacterium]
MTAPIDDALRVELRDKLRQLLQRERDVHTLLREVATANRWVASAAQLAATIAGFQEELGALGALADAFAEELGYEYAVAQWGPHRAERPAIAEPALAAAIAHALAAPCPDGYARELHDDGPVRELVRFVIGSARDPADTVRVVVVRTARTAPYFTTPDDTGRERTRQLAALLAQSFDAVRLRRDLVGERDAL